MATHSSILAWKIPWTEEPGGLQAMGSRRVGHNLAHARMRAHTHTHTHTGILLSYKKKNETLPFAATWMDLKGIMLSEITQTEETQDIIYMRNLKNATRPSLRAQLVKNPPAMQETPV